MNEKIIIEMGSQIISIEFGFSFPTIYHNVMYANGKVPPKIMLLYGGISSYSYHELTSISCVKHLRPRFFGRSKHPGLGFFRDA